MVLELQLLGACSASVVVEGSRQPLKTSLKLLVHLALSPPDGWFRDDLASALWPYDESEVCQNRLRVALSKLRSSAPGAILDFQGRLRINEDVVRTDIAVVQDAVRRVEDEVLPERELEGWLGIEKTLASAINDRHVSQLLEDKREEWAAWAGSKLLRAAELALNLKRAQSAKTLSLAALAHCPGSIEAASALQRSCLALGDLGPMRVLSPSLLQALNHRSGSLDQDSWPGDELDVTSALRESLLASRIQAFSHEIISEVVKSSPDVAVPLLAAPQLLPLVGSHPRLAALLLEKAVLASNPEVKEWPRCAARLIGLWAWQDEAEKASKLAPAILALSEEPLIRRAVFSAMASLEAVRGRWAEAERALDQAESLALEKGSDLDVCTVRGTRACHLWMQGRFDESEAAYDEVLAVIRTLNDPRAHFEAAIAERTRAYIPMMKGDFERARRALETARIRREERGIALPPGLDGPCQVMLQVATGGNGDAARQLKSHFMSLFDHGSPRMLLAGLEFGSACLLWLGLREQAVKLLNWLEQRRIEAGFPRCKAELRLFEEAVRQTAGRTREGWGQDSPLGSLEDLAVWLVRTIRESSVQKWNDHP